MIAVARSPVQTLVSWEYPEGVWALLPWSGRPMTPHYCNWQPRAGGRSYTPFQPRMRRWYYAPSGRHDLPRRDGRHITPDVAACIGLDKATSNTPSLLLHQPVGKRSVLTSLLHLVTLLHPRTPPSLYDIARSPL